MRASGERSRLGNFNTWDDFVRLLPKDRVGNPDWDAALDERIIAPLPGITPGAVEQETLSLDVEISSKSDPAFNVIFSHQKHGAWLACSNCHPSPFEMTAGATPMTAEEVHAGRYCAACHGKVAFEIVTGCPLCHLQTLPKDANGVVDWDRALAQNLIRPRAGAGAKAEDQPTFDLDVELTSSTHPTFKSLFSHTSHTKWLACTNCHPSLFPMEKGAPEMKDADFHSRRYCGACHGSVAFGLTGACARCHPDVQQPRHHQPGLDLDVEVPSKSQPSSTTIFSHKIHSRWLECPVCHASAYDTTGATKVTRADLFGGKYCAACHGKVTADLMTRCQPCHAVGDAR